MKYINVIVDDGNRSTNWDYPPDVTVGEVIAKLKYRPVKGTVKVWNELVGDDLNVKLMDCPQELAPDGKHMRVRITMKEIPPKNSPIVVAGNEWLLEGDGINVR